MTKKDWERVRGLVALLHQSVGSGATFVERHHRRAAEAPFALLEAIPPLRKPTRLVKGAYRGTLSISYGSVRVINRALSKVDDWVLRSQVEANQDPGEED